MFQFFSDFLNQLCAVSNSCVTMSRIESEGCSPLEDANGMVK